MSVYRRAGAHSPDEKNLPHKIVQVPAEISQFQDARTRGELGSAIALCVLRYSPNDIEQMRHNFRKKIRYVTLDYRALLEEKIAEHWLGTWQALQLMQQQGLFSQMIEPVPAEAHAYWEMVKLQCPDDARPGTRLRFLKFLFAGFCMLVQREPGHPTGTPFPGGDTIHYSDGVYYCPVREKANDVADALCPFCPALQTPAIGYLKPPVNGSEHRKQEFIRNCHDFHNFNG